MLTANTFIHSDTKGVMVRQKVHASILQKGSKVIAADLGRYVDYN